MKKLAGKVTAVFLAVVMVFTFMPLAGDHFAVHAEDTAGLSVTVDDEGTLSWEELEGADYYEYYINDIYVSREAQSPQYGIDVQITIYRLISYGELEEAETYTVTVKAFQQGDGDEPLLLAEESVEYTPPQIAEIDASITDGILSWEAVDGTEAYRVYIGGCSVTFDSETLSMNVDRKIDQMIRSRQIESSDEGYEIWVEARDPEYEVIGEWKYTYQYESASAPVSVGEITGLSLDEETNTAVWDEYTDSSEPTVCYRFFVEYPYEGDTASSESALIEDTEYMYRWFLEDECNGGSFSDGDEITVGVRAYTYVDPENIPDDIDEIDPDDLIKTGECSETMTFNLQGPEQIDARITAGHLTWEPISRVDWYELTINGIDPDIYIEPDGVYLPDLIDRMIRNHQLEKADNGMYSISLEGYSDGINPIAVWDDEYEYASDAEPVEVVEMNVSISDGKLVWEPFEDAFEYIVTASCDGDQDSKQSWTFNDDEFSADLDDLFCDIAYSIDNDGWEIAEDGMVPFTVEAVTYDDVTLARGSCKAEYYKPENYVPELWLDFSFDEDTKTLSWEPADGAKYYTVTYTSFDDVESAQVRLGDGVTEFDVEEFLEQQSQEAGAPELYDGTVHFRVRAYNDSEELIGGSTYSRYSYEKTYPDIEGVNFDEETGLLTWQKGEGVGEYRLAYEYWREVDTTDFTIEENNYSVNVYDFLDQKSLSGVGLNTDEDGNYPLVLIAYEDSEEAPLIAEHKFSVAFEPREAEDIEASISEDGVLSWSPVEGAAGYRLYIDGNVIEIDEGDPAFEANECDLKAEIDDLVENGYLYNTGTFMIDFEAVDGKDISFAFWSHSFEYISDKVPPVEDIDNVRLGSGMMTWDAPENAASYTIRINRNDEWKQEGLTGTSFGIADFIEPLGIGEDGEYMTEGFAFVELFAYDSSGRMVGSWEDTYVYPEPTEAVKSFRIGGIYTDLRAGEEVPDTVVIGADMPRQEWDHRWTDVDTGEILTFGGDGGYNTVTAPVAGHTYRYSVTIGLDHACYFSDDVAVIYEGQEYRAEDGLIVEDSTGQRNKVTFSGFVEDVTVPGGEAPVKKDIGDADVRMLYNEAGGYRALNEKTHLYSADEYSLDDLEDLGCEVIWNGRTLVNGRDYEVTLENNTGTRNDMRAIFTGKGDYKGSEKVIENIPIAKVSAVIKDMVLDPTGMDPQKMVETVRIEAGDGIPEKTLTRNVDYIVAGPDIGRVPGNKNASIQAEGSSDYVGAILVPVRILPAPMSQVTVTMPKAVHMYSGKAFTPLPTVTYRSSSGKTMTLTKDTDYTVSYVNNVNAGTATVKVTGKWKFAGTKTVTFPIVKAKGTLAVKAKTAALKAKKLKKKAQTLKVSKVLAVSKVKGKLSYSKKSGNKKITVNTKTGKVTCKKGLKKGTYKVKVAVKDAGNKNFNAVTRTVTFKVKVK